MSELITIVKNQQVQSSKEQSKSGNSRYNWKNQIKNSEKGGRNLRGPDVNQKWGSTNSMLQLWWVGKQSF